MLSENARKVFDYVKANDGKDFTAADIAEALDLNVKVINGVVTSAFTKKELMVRTPAEMEVTGEDGKVSHKAIKLISLTDKGRSFDPDKSEEVAE